MTYEYYKANYKKLRRAERNSNKEFRKRFFEEAHQRGIEMIKTSMDERLDTYMREKEAK